MTGVRHLFSAAEAERCFGIPAATIRSWARRRRLFSAGLDERDRPLYDRADFLRLRELSGRADTAGSDNAPAVTVNHPGARPT